MFKTLAKRTIPFFFKSLDLMLFKKKDIIIFSQSGSRYSGNSRYFFEYLVRNNFNVYWLYTDEIQRNKIPKAFKSHLIHRNTIEAFKVVVAAKYFVISYSGSDLGLFWYIAKNNTVISLWHAIGIKKVALLDKKFTNLISDNYINNEISHYSYMTVSSEIDRYTTSSSHGIDIRKVLVAGNPKTDNYLKSIKFERNPIDRKILYAPTFRDYELKTDLFFPFSDFSLNKLKMFFEKHSDIKIYLRPHPSDFKSIEQATELQGNFPKNVVNFSTEICDDVDEYMFQFDLIITDYSSIYMEPLLADVPCIFIPFDYEYYIQTRGLAYEYHTITPGPIVSSFSELIDSIKDGLTGAPNWAVKRKIVKNMFFKYEDDQACRRIAQQVFDFKPNFCNKKKV